MLVQYVGEYIDFASSVPRPQDWASFCPADIAEAVASFDAAASGLPLVGLGHSMGGAGLCLAALADPSRFAKVGLPRLVCAP